MAESQATRKLTLDPKEKTTGALVIGIAFATFIVALVTTAIFAVPLMSKPPPKHYYPDIIEEDNCSSCWEATVFATSSDPFYQWFSESSVPDALNVSQRGVLAYQRASIWRVLGNITSSGNANLYSSPDPHILGGEIVKRSRTLLWKMTVYWGMSVRTCFTLPGTDASCLYTTPIVQKAPGSYAALLVGVPYRKASSQDPYAAESSVLYLDTSSKYLTNFMSNARTGPGLKLNFKSDGKGIKNYVYEGQNCSQGSLILPTPDVVSYTGFPSFQCACDGTVCVVGFNLTGSAPDDSGINPFKLNGAGCAQGNSFWEFDSYNLEKQTVTFYSYSPRSEIYIRLQVSFSTSTSGFAFFNNGSREELKAFVSCTEDTIKENPGDARALASDLQSKCVSGNVIGVTAAPWFKRFIHGALPTAVMDTFNSKVPTSDKENNAMCGLEDGQAKLADNLCMVSLEDLRTSDEMERLEVRLNESLKVEDVRRFVKKEWNSSSSQRSDITVGIVTAVVTILVTILGMFNRELQEVDAFILKRAGKFRIFLEGTIGLPLFKTGIRGIVLLGVIAWNLFNVFMSLSAVDSEPRLATSKTLLQQLGDISFLVTTTSTVQVTPYWIVFFAACSFAIFLFVTATFGVYVGMCRVENKEKDSEGDAVVPKEKPNASI